MNSAKHLATLVVFSTLCCAFGSERHLGRVVGGVDVDIVDAPWQASVEVSGTPRCSGSLITQNMVLTAGSCTIEFYPEEMQVRVGTAQLNSGGEVYAVQAVLIHQNLNLLNHDYDVSLVQLVGNVNVSEAVQPIELAGNATEPALGTQLNVTGWSLADGSSADNLQMTSLVTVERSTCLGGAVNLTERQLCAESEPGTSSGTCGGDWGGPVVVDGVQVGVVSATPLICGSENSLTVVASIGEQYTREWIQYFAGI